MSAYDVMLSESQERMLLIVKEGREAPVREIFERWDIDASVIGRVTNDRMARVIEGGRVVAEVDVGTLVDAPQYTPGGVRPAYLDILNAAALPSEPPPSEAGRILRSLLSSPNIASKRSVYRQYDHEVQTNTMAKPGAGDAAVLRIRGAGKAIAVAIDGNGRHAYLDPYAGGAMAVAEACRNVVCGGGAPLAVTDCLNFGDPRNPEVYYQLEQCIRGIAAACDALGVPVVSGNVSLYNESGGEAIYPTPVVGAVGLLPDASARLTAGFAHDGDLVVLLGETAAGPETFGGSEYLDSIHGMVAGRPAIDLAAEARVQSLVASFAAEGVLRSAHDCSDGGLAAALAECAVLGGRGLAGKLVPYAGRWDAMLFGEAPSRIVVSCAAAELANVEERARAAGVPTSVVGSVGGNRFTIAGLLDESLAELTDAFEGGLERALAG